MKQAILVRQDLKLSKGKMAVQVSHASVDAVLRSDRTRIKNWKAVGMPKVVLKVKDLKELLIYRARAQRAGLVTSLIKDSAKTFFKRPTITCVAIGPNENKKVDQIIKDLKLV